MNISTFLVAIAMVESGENDLATGKAGETSRYQITPLVWRAYARPGESPIVQADAERVAVRFIEAELIPALKRRERPVTVKSLAACWNYGPKASYSEWPRRVEDYAGRVATLYELRMREE